MLRAMFLIAVVLPANGQAYAHNGGLLSLMHDDKLYDVMPPGAVTQATIAGLDCAMTGTNRPAKASGVTKKAGFFKRLFGDSK